MSQTLADLVQVAVAGRYVVSPWGIFPRPRLIGRMPAGIDPEQSQSLAYGKLVRHLERKKTLKFPFQNHSLIDLESHLRALGALEQTFESKYGLELLARQADMYVAAWAHNHRQGSKKMRAASLAFREIWDIIRARMSDTCPNCELMVKKRLALSGFVD